jgi:flavin-dependent dehydrogenase
MDLFTLVYQAVYRNSAPDVSILPMEQEQIGDFDVAVLGASLAGSASALRLGRSGLRVALIDQAVIPRTKACGEGFSKLGYAALQELLGAAEAASVMNAVGALPLTGYQISHRGVVRSLTFPKHSAKAGPEPTALAPVWGIERQHFDRLVQNKAKALPSVSCYLGERVKTVETTSSGVELTCESGVRIRSRALIVACGFVRSILEQLCGPLSEASAQRSAAALRWRGAPHQLAPHVRVRLTAGAQWIINPTSSTSLNINMLGRPPVLSAKQFLRAARAIVQELGLDPAYLGEVHGAADVSAQVQPAPKSARVFLVGDSAERLDPLGGMGMTHALLSAQAAAHTVHSALRGELTFEQAAESYGVLRESLAAPLRQYTGMLSGVLLRAPLALHLPAPLFTFAARTADRLHLARSERRRQAMCQAFAFQRSGQYGLAGQDATPQ